MESPTYEGSFELDESLAGSVERSTSKARLATRTPQHLAQRLAASSVDSVASDLEVSKRSVTFSRRKATSAPRRPFANDATPNPTDDEAEYSEDFDADADALQSSASYAEDFEPSAAKSYGDDFENESTGPAPAPARPAAFRARALPSAASSMAYSSDFEKGSVASARVKSRAAAGARAAAAAVPPPPPSLDALLHALASSARLPQQVADLRSQISKLAPESHAARGPLEAPPSATLDDTGIPTAFAAAGGSTHARGRASSYNTHRRKKTGASGRSRAALEQLEVDLVHGERQHRREGHQRAAERGLAQQRAMQRRKEHEAQLHGALDGARDAARALAVATALSKDLEARLSAASAARDAAVSARDDVSAALALRVEQADALAAHAAMLAAEAAANASERAAEEKRAAEESAIAAAEASVLRAAIDSAERRCENLLERLPELEARRVAAEDRRLDDNRVRLADDRVALAREREAFAKGLDGQRASLEEEHRVKARRVDVEADELRRSLAASRAVADESARRERERLSGHAAALDAGRAALAREAAQLDVARNKFAEDRLEFATKRAALQPKFDAADAAAERAAEQAQRASAAQAHAQRGLDQLRADRADLEARRTAVDADLQRGLDALERAEGIERRCAAERQALSHRTADFEKTRFAVLAQQQAFARQVVGLRHAASTATPGRALALVGNEAGRALVSAPASGAADFVGPAFDAPDFGPDYGALAGPRAPRDDASDAYAYSDAYSDAPPRAPPRSWPALPPPAAYDENDAPRGSFAPHVSRAAPPDPWPPPSLQLEAKPHSILRRALDDLPQPGAFAKAARDLDAA